VPYEDRSTTKPLTGTVFYVLLALADRQRYGLDIVKEIARRTNGAVRLGPGTLYNAVKKMLSQGLIEETAAAGAAAEVDPRRRYYRITRAGREAVAAEAARLEQLVDAAKTKSILPANRTP
jgi:DNA-binding PadR family transcriptional regulator